jgi:integrase
MAKRRGHGEGSITQRKDGRWQGQVDLGWQDGRRRRKFVYGRTRRAVSDALTRALRAAQDGTLLTDERQTVGQFLAHWLRDVARPRVRPRTLDTYEAAITLHIVPTLGKRALARLSPQDCQAWISTLAAQGVPVGRIRYARVVLRNALNTAVRWRLVSQNVAALADAPRMIAREIRPLSPDQAKQLLKTAAGQPLEGFVAIALGCGLRLGEALALKWSDVDLDAGTLRVHYALQRSGGDAVARRPLLSERRRLHKALRQEQSHEERHAVRRLLQEIRGKLQALKTGVQLVEPKSSRSRRTLALPVVTIAALRTHRVRQLEARLAAGGHWQDQGFVFTSPIGTPLDQSNVSKDFKRLLRAAGLPPIRIHDLRHSCATLLLAQGVDPRTIMETLGHSQISLTLNTYSHVLPALQRAAAAKMDAALS